MDVSQDQMNQIKQQQLKTAFQQNHILCDFMNREELNAYLKSILKDHISVSVGGSVTLSELNILHQLETNNDIEYYDRYQEGLTREEIQKVYHQALNADLYITSTNAISMEGNLYNIDGNGNRVAAMIYGPAKVLVLVGRNKIFATEEEAIQHIRTVSAPTNCMRLNKDTPCTKVGKCVDCKTADRICCHYVKQSYQQVKDRIHVIVIDEVLGY